MSQRRREAPETIELLVPPELDQRRLFEVIEQRLPARRASERTLSCRLYDSFDWRLFNAGCSLHWCFGEAIHPPVSAGGPEARSDAQANSGPNAGPNAGPNTAQPMAEWRELDKPGVIVAQQSMPTAPGLLDEMPPGPVRERLAPLLEMRRLLARVDLISQQTPFRLLNEDEKTVVRLIVEQNRFRDPTSGRGGTLMRRLRLCGIRGYAEELEQARILLQDEVGCPSISEPLTTEALIAAGHRPGTYSTKLDRELDPNERADLATKQILRGLLQTLEANIEGARQNLDSEFLHDLRVATRRTRSALGQIKAVFPEDQVADFKQRFAWLQQVTGPVRDLDVYLLDLPAMEQRLPAPLRGDLEPLREQLVGQYAQAQRQLARELGSARFARLLSDWRAFLDAPVASADARQAQLAPPVPAVLGRSVSAVSGPSGCGPSWGRLPRRAALPIKQVADLRVRKLLKQVRAEGRAITDDSPPQDLHELRKRCKKLRYLMEFFQSLYQKDQIREQIKQTKRLLDNLGRFQDTAVQVQHLRGEAEGAEGAEGGIGAGGSRLPPQTLLAMGALVGQLLDEQARARAAFSEVFAEFDSAENASRFKALLKGEVQESPEPSNAVILGPRP